MRVVQPFHGPCHRPETRGERGQLVDFLFRFREPRVQIKAVKRRVVVSLLDHILHLTQGHLRLALFDLVDFLLPPNGSGGERAAKNHNGGAGCILVLLHGIE